MVEERLFLDTAWNGGKGHTLLSHFIALSFEVIIATYRGMRISDNTCKASNTQQVSF